MESQYQKDDRYERAMKRVEDIKGFYGNLGSYIVVNLGLMILNLVTTPEHLWFYWPMIGWGIGVIFHGMKVFNYVPFFGKEWEEKKLKQFLEEEKRMDEYWQ